MEEFPLISATNQPMENQFKAPFVLLVNGEYPTHTVPLKILHSAKTIICTDGSANTLMQNRIQPHIIIGDMDSLKITEESFDGLLIHDPNQESTDLEKSLDCSIKKKINDLTILGATGLREDHSLANLFIVAEYHSKLNLKMITNHFIITCHTGSKEFDSNPGQTVSLFTVKPDTIVTTQHLNYPLKKTVLSPSCRAISNESLNSLFTVESDKPILVFRNHNKL